MNPKKTEHKMVDVHSVDAARKALSVFFKIAAAWALNRTEQERVLGVSKPTLYRWEKGEINAGLDSNVIERLSYIFRIYGALQVLLPAQDRAHGWVRAANTAPLFGGRSALDRMLAGQVGDLMAVAQYLDAHRGGDFS